MPDTSTTLREHLSEGQPSAKLGVFCRAGTLQHPGAEGDEGQGWFHRGHGRGTNRWLHGRGTLRQRPRSRRSTGAGGRQRLDAVQSRGLHWRGRVPLGLRALQRAPEDPGGVAVLRAERSWGHSCQGWPRAVPARPGARGAGAPRLGAACAFGGFPQPLRCHGRDLPARSVGGPGQVPRDMRQPRQPELPPRRAARRRPGRLAGEEEL
mmetsp:Transcript_71503/g.225903  ORF Transcript_71503/g.225903 Transcript_71503/m.225903 type:complete len:208 (+) Transcript_71503:575-1198(+)